MKAKKDFNLFVMPDATLREIDEFKEAISQKPNHVIINKECKVYVIKKGQVFQIVSREIPVKKSWVKEILKAWHRGKK